MRCTFFILLIGLAVSAAPALADPGRLGEPLQFPEEIQSLPGPEEPDRSRARALSVNPQNKEASRQFYNTYYASASGGSINWTGNHASCNAGATGQAFRDAVLLRINYFRAMAGVPAAVTFSSAYNAKAQEAALMMSVNDDLDHTPPGSWTCYTADGAEAAGKSNLYLRSNGVSAISGYVKDFGAGNYAAGHRRWILYPKTQNMGTGDVPSASGHSSSNALWVIGAYGSRPATREDYVAWPPPGHVPYAVVYPRWSFSYDGATFSSASVTMTRNGASFPVSLETVQYGYGENTLVWIPDGMSSYASWPVEDGVTYHASIANVSIGGGTESFSYYVYVFDPTQYNDAYVSNASGPPCAGNNPCYTTIQSAIDGEDLGTVIHVAKGTYSEQVDIGSGAFLELCWDTGFTTIAPTGGVILTPPPVP